jgi:SAM-dependent methyltransferase
MPAPIALFVYKRPAHTRRTLQALTQNELAAASTLYVFADGPKASATEADLAAIAEVRRLVSEQAWCGQVRLVERAQNLGLANSIISGVTELVQAHGRVIVLEDDLVTSPQFLRYMNQALDFYADEEKVAAIHGYCYPLRPAAGQTLPATYFSKNPGCWGWATWARAWRYFEPDAAKLLAQIEGSGRSQEFDYEHFPYANILRDQITGGVDAWAIRWYASLFVNRKLALWPGASLVHNIGNDNTGVHSVTTHRFDVALAAQAPPVQPQPLAEHPALRALTREFYAGFGQGRKYLIIKKLKKIKRWLVAQRRAWGRAWSRQLAPLRSVHPRTRDFGFSQGQPVDRYYMAQFMAQHRADLRGVALEVASSEFSEQFGAGQITRYEVLHVDPTEYAATLIGQLDQPATLPADVADCFVCTQTFHVIYRLRQAIAGAHRLLKPGGVLLATLPGITQVSRFDMDRWGDYWRLTDRAALQLFSEVFGPGQVTVTTYGNVLAATALLQGRSHENFTRRELDHHDPDYPVLIGVRAVKLS